MLPVLMVPGLGSDAAVWQPTIDELSPEYDCTVGSTFSDGTLSGMAARILEEAPDRFALAGISMGGMVALEIMRAAPGRVARLALFDTNARPDTPEQTERRRTVNAAMLQAEDLATLAAPAVANMVHAGADRRVRDALLAMTVRVGPLAYVRQNEAVMARDDLRPVLATVRVPTMVVVGADDAVTPVAYAREIAGSIAGAVLHVVPECGHLPPLERPAAAATLIRDWLRERGP